MYHNLSRVNTGEALCIASLSWLGGVAKAPVCNSGLPVSHLREGFQDMTKGLRIPRVSRLSVLYGAGVGRDVGLPCQPHGSGTPLRLCVGQSISHLWGENRCCLPAFPRAPWCPPQACVAHRGAMIFLAFAIASMYVSGGIIGVNFGSLPVNQVRVYMSSATVAGFSSSTTMKRWRRVGSP